MWSAMSKEGAVEETKDAGLQSMVFCYYTLQQYLEDINIKMTQESKLLPCFTHFSFTVSNRVTTVTVAQKGNMSMNYPEGEIDSMRIDYCALSHR